MMHNARPGRAARELPQPSRRSLKFYRALCFSALAVAIADNAARTVADKLGQADKIAAKSASFWEFTDTRGDTFSGVGSQVVCFAGVVELSTGLSIRWLRVRAPSPSLRLDKPLSSRP